MKPRRRFRQFIRDEFGFDYEAQYRLYRIYFLISALLAPVILFGVIQNRETRYLWLDIFFPLFFSGIFTLSFLNEWVKNNLRNLFFTFCYFATMYAYMSLFQSDYQISDFIGFLLAFCAISIGIQDHRYVFFYGVSMLLLIGAGAFYKTEGNIDPWHIFIIVLIISIVCLIIHYSRFVLLRKLNESRADLRAGRDRLLTVLDSIDNTVYNVAIDERGNRHIRYVSGKIENLTGMTVDEYITEVKSGRLLDRIHPDDLPDVIEQSRVLNEEKKPVSIVFRFLRDEEQTNYIWIEEKVFPRLDDKGRHIANIGISNNVTARIEGEKALRDSEARYRHMIERNLAGFYRVDSRHRLVDCNQAFAHILGFQSKEEIIGLPVNQLYRHSSDENRFVAMLREKINIRNHESHLTLRSGKQIWLLENVSLIAGNKQEHYQIEGTVFDITEQKNAQLETERARNNLTMVINNINSLVYSLDVDENGQKEFVFLGPQITDITGISREQYIQEIKTGELNRYIHPDDLPQIAKNFDRIRQQKKSVSFTYRFWSRKKNEYVWLEETMFPQFNAQGRIYRIFGVVRDVSEKIRYEDALLKSEESYRMLFERNLAGVFRTTMAGSILDCNDAFVHIFGYSSKEEMMSQRSHDLYFSDHERETYISHLRARKELSNYEILHRRKDGSALWALINVSLITDNDLETDILLGTLIDITDRMKAETAMRESEKRFMLLAASTIEGIIFFEEEGRIIDSNDQFALLHGYASNREITGRHINDFVVEEDRNLVQQQLHNRSEEIIEIRTVSNEGEISWFESKVSVIPSSSRMLGVLVVYEITERKKHEEAIINSKRAYEQLVEGSPYGIFIHNEGKVFYANHSTFEIVGIDRNEFEPGKFSLYQFILPEYISEAYERRQKLLQGEEVPFIRIRIYNSAGEVLDIETKSQLIIYEGQTAIQTTIKDVSTELQLQKEKLRAEIAEQANKQLASEITEHKRTQVKLVEIQQYLQNIIGSSIDMIMASDIHNAINEVNPAALVTFGYTREELIGKHPRILYADEAEFEKINQHLSQNGTFSGEIINRRSNGEAFTSYISASLIRNNQGEVIGSMGVSRDITEIIEAEKIVREQNAKINSIFDNTSNMLIWTLNRAYCITSFNRNFAEIIRRDFGIEVHTGMNFLDGLRRFIEEESFEPLREKYARAFQGIPQELDGPLTSPRGNWLWFETYLNPILLETGEIDEISCVSHDVTDKKQTQYDLRKNEERNKAMINALPDLIFRMSKEGVYQEVFYKHDHELVIPPSQFVGKKITDHFTENGLGERFLSNIRTSLETNRVVQFEYKMELNGYPGFFEARYAKINEHEVLVIIRDITEKKQADENLLASLKEKEVLLKEVHHRVKNNLQVISSILNLQSSYVKEESTLQILRESQNRIKSMSFIHESLYQTKNFSSINFSEYIVNLSKNLVHSYQVFSNLIELKFNVGELDLNLDQAIPCGLIINELVSNALKYAFNEDQEGTIYIGLREENNHIHLKVEDDGKGLPEGFDYTSTETLGLQLVLTLVEQLDGKIELDSRGGTKYLIIFEKLN